ncbi:MAG: helix-turn-helix transcriptional regulator [Clostridia bacterium]|nr:helix-turn-helix transcriptional regulator [Clostridia bacterium]
MINGERMKELMKEQGITNKELAEAVGVTEAMISYIIRGLRDTTVATMVRIANRLGVKVDELLESEAG